MQVFGGLAKSFHEPNRGWRLGDFGKDIASSLFVLQGPQGISLIEAGAKSILRIARVKGRSMLHESHGFIGITALPTVKTKKLEEVGARAFLGKTEQPGLEDGDAVGG